MVFDVEGVLVDGEFLPSLAALVGREEEARKITYAGIKGEIDWEEGLKQRVELVKGVRYEECVRIANSLPLMKGADEAIKEIKDMDAIIVGVSGGFSLLGERVKEELGLDHVFSNQLVFHNGKLIGYGLLVNANKSLILRSAFGGLLESHKKVAVVDGANDLDLFKMVDHRIAFNAQPIVTKEAHTVITEKDLTRVSRVIKGLHRYA